MFSRLLIIICLLFVCCPCDLAIAQPSLELEGVEKVWDQGPHNAFTDLRKFQGKWVLAFREAAAHQGGVKGSKIRVLVSDNASEWKTATTIEDPRGDIRDAKLAETPTGELMLLTATQFFDTRQQRHQSHAWFTDDLENWQGPKDVADSDYWAWGIQFHEQIGYSIGYRTVEPRGVRLYQTTDGRSFQSLVDDLKVDSPYPNESAIVFDKTDTAYCLLRCQGSAQLGIASPPYQDWNWTVTNRPVGGPELIQLPNGRFLGGGRLYDGGARTSLFWLDPETATITEALKLPSGGDTSYPGFVLDQGTLYVSYYSSHEGKSSIYLARVKVNLNEAESQTENTIGNLPVVELQNRRELFLDGFLVERFSGEAGLDLHSPMNREIVFTHDRPWEGNTSAYHTVFQEGDQYHMYYRGSHVAALGSGRFADHPEVTCYAQSSDGIQWERPNLGLFEFQGSKDNNIVLAGDPATHNFAPFLDQNPSATAEEKYKALGRGPGGLYAFRSADGIRWERMQEQPVITDGAFDSLNVAYFDTTRNRYVEFHRDFRNGVRDIKTTTSQDFLNWEDPRWLEYPGAEPQHLYTNGIISYPRAPHLFVGLAKRFVPGRNPQHHPSSGVSDAILMSSRDGKTFDRWPEAVVRPGLQSSRWVNRNNLPAWGMVETAPMIRGLPNELSIYTTGDYYTGDAATLRRHSWRLDGMVSVSAAASGGEMVTVPVTFTAAPASLVAKFAESTDPNDWYNVVEGSDATFSSDDRTDATAEDGNPVQTPETNRNDAGTPGTANHWLKILAPTVIKIPETRSLGKRVTLAARVKDVPAGMRRLFSTYNGRSPSPGELYFDFDSDGNNGRGTAIRFQYDRFGVQVPEQVIGNWSQDNRPHHLVAVWDDGLIRIYFDGKQVGQGGMAGAGELTSRVGDLQFGEDYSPTSQANEPFLGQVDDILVLREALTDEQVQRLYVQGTRDSLDLEQAKGILYAFESVGPNQTDQDGTNVPLADHILADGQQSGQVTTIRERTSRQRGATELLLNLSTSGIGSAKIELQEMDGSPIPGFTLSDCDEMIGDDTAMPVSWNRRTEVSSLGGRPIRIRFVLKDADLYSMQFHVRDRESDE